jgi:hypothetical protein
VGTVKYVHPIFTFYGRSPVLNHSLPIFGYIHNSPKRVIVCVGGDGAGIGKNEPEKHNPYRYHPRVLYTVD